MGGLLRLVQQGADWALSQAPITVFLYNCPLLCCAILMFPLRVKTASIYFDIERTNVLNAGEPSNVFTCNNFEIVLRTF